MIWLAFAILTAFFESLKDVLSKHSLNKLDTYVVAWASMLFTALLLLPVLWIVHIPPLGPQFWLALLGGGSLNVVAFTLYIKAIKVSDLSLTVPMVTLTPLFLLVTSPWILRESASLADVIGICLIVAGSYVLNLKARSAGYFAPVRALFREPGTRFMFLVALLWSFTSTFDKIGVQNSSPIFWAFALFTFLAVGMLPIALYKSRPHLHQIGDNLGILSAIGLCTATAVAFQMWAVNLTLLTNVIAIKRTSALMSVYLGHLIFKEKGLQERLLGAAVMVVGVIIMTLW
jgi:drug/metabolite transporter (DMT)-like permease